MLAVGCIAGYIAGCGREPDWNRPRPNVLLIVLDTVRADYLSCYGGSQPTTPRIDRLAAEATRFDRAYATDFWTLPSHASLLTGLFPSQAGATSETNFLPAEATTLAERLAGAGYATGAVVRNAWLSEERGFRQGFTDFVEAWRGNPDRPDLEGERQAVEQATVWLRQRAPRPDPFFLFVNLNIAHLPYDPPPPARERFLGVGHEPARVERMTGIRGGWAHVAGALTLDDTDLHILAKLYATEVALADELAGELLDALAELRILDRTLVILTSDHGENLGEHGLIDHLQSMYETTVRVPLIVRFPERFGQGVVDRRLVSLTDLVPTVLDVSGLDDELGELPSGWISLGDSRSPPRPAVFAENARPVNGVRRLRRLFPQFDASVVDHPLRMMRGERFKLIWRPDRGAELYDLVSDPAESVDLAGAQLARRDEMLLALRAWVATLGASPARRRFVSRDPESLERLRDLGYLD